jgi:pyridoxamine 5'-phosphate oxidase
VGAGHAAVVATRVDPIERFAAWFARARRTGGDPEPMALATAAADGRPAVRFVLLKQVDQRGFVFFTDARSRKGRELATNPRAALALFWPTTRRQVRVEGRVERVSRAEADAYWATRPRASRLEARASRQSAVLRSRGALLARWKDLRRRYRGRPIPRPTSWTGFRIVPETIEFWTHRDHRLHDRERFVRGPRGWRRALLQP